MTIMRPQDCIYPVKFVLIPLNLTLRGHHAKWPVQKGARREKMIFFFKGLGRKEN